MAKLRGPKNSAAFANGVEYKADKDGFIEAHDNAVKHLEAHGFVKVNDNAKAEDFKDESKDESKSEQKKSK